MVRKLLAQIDGWDVLSLLSLGAVVFCLTHVNLYVAGLLVAILMLMFSISRGRRV